MPKTTEFKIIVPTKEISLNCAYILYQFYQESDMNTMFEFDKEKTASMVDFFIDNEDSCVFIAVVDKEIVGIIIGLASELAFSRGKAATEMAWWVKPEHRNSRISFELMKHYEDWCVDQGIKVCVMSTYPNVSPPKLGKFYEKRGYQMGEVSYRKVLN